VFESVVVVSDVQAAPSFPACFPVPLKGSTEMPCLIPCAIDQVRGSGSPRPDHRSIIPLACY
jgi:hypothetical protein